MLVLLLVFLLSGVASAYDLSDAMDTNLVFTTGGSADWFGQSTMFCYDGDAAQSGYISDSQESWMRTTVSGLTRVSFYWKVSSESGYDFLKFSIDGSLQDSIDGFEDWQQMIYTFSTDSHTLEWRYVKDESASSGNDCGWVDQVEWGTDPQPPPFSADLSEALDTTLIFTTGGSADWFAQNSTFYYDGDAAQSGGISGNQVSWMQTTVSGPTTVSFYWTVFSEFHYDFLEFYIDDVLQDSIHGSYDFGPLDWQRMAYTLGSGLHTLRWQYVKDEVDDAGDDCGWVDYVTSGTEPGPPPSTCDLSEALDTSLSFTTGGSGDWVCQSTTTYYDGDATQSGSISHAQESWMQTTVSGPTTVSFYWKVSSESGYDFLEFYIDDSLRGSISGSADWQQKTYTLASGSHTLEWRYIKDGSISSGSDCGWVDLVELGTDPGPQPSPCDLDEALDTSLIVTTGGSADWFCQDVTFYNDGDAAQSGDILDNEVSWMRTTVGEAGTVKFYWKVSSEDYCDFLEFYVNGLLHDRISGTLDWQQMTYTLPSGSHTLEWQYIKDGSISSGSDCGWVDGVELGTDPGPQPSCDLSEALDTSLIFTAGGSADWFCQDVTFYNGGDAAQSGDILDNEVSWMRTTVGGAGTVKFYWKVSSEDYCDFLEFYVNGLLHDRISGMVDWQQMTYTLPSASHVLEWRYMKDFNMGSHSDCGWVDQVEWLTDSQPPSPPPSCDLSEALDTTLIFDTEGSADWFCQGTSYYGGDAAQSGNIGHNQLSWMETTVSGPTTVSFYWKVSSEEGYDFLQFYLDHELQDSISGSVDWQRMMYTLPSGSHTLFWRYVKDGSANFGNDCGWVDKLEFEAEPEPIPSCDLSEALDTTLIFTTEGDADWFCQGTSYYGGDAAQSGTISDSQESWMRTTVSEPTTVSFYWKVSSEVGYDFLEFYINDQLIRQISGSVDWEPMVYTLPSISNKLEWRYFKDGSNSSVDDCGWVDRIELGTDPQPPPPTGDLSDALDTSLSFTTGGDNNMNWFRQYTTSYYDGDAAQSGGISHNEESWIQTTVNGEGKVSFYWKVSSEEDCDFLEFFIDGSVYNWISGSVDWQQMAHILGPGSHTLEWLYYKDISDSVDSDCGWVDWVQWVPDQEQPSCDLPEGLDTTTLSFITGGNANWFCQDTTFYYDGDAAQSGHISDNQNSWMQTTVSGPATVSFTWKVSSETDYDYLEFYIDGLLKYRISGSMDWHQMASTTLEWRYVKDYSVGIGNDCGWVDFIEVNY
jgi:hypothetical protein